MAVITRRLTYDEYLALPESRQRYEIVDGELIMVPSPTPRHQWISANLFRALDRFIRAHHLGVLLYAPLDVVIQRSPLRVRQPDLLFLSAQRSGITDGAQLQDVPLLPHPPDLVIEILSPANPRRGMEEKLADYRQVGVRECWIVSPEAQTVEVMRLSPEVELLDIFGTGMTVYSEVLEGFSLPVEYVFSTHQGERGGVSDA
ncbi:MAG: Uma2 family endonuclease [Nitrospinota bacterium]|nr:MAG: Uma2 family endonuclease [Nitrospinota bacterium]